MGALPTLPPITAANRRLESPRDRTRGVLPRLLMWRMTQKIKLISPPPKPPFMTENGLRSIELDPGVANRGERLVRPNEQDVERQR